MKRQIVFIFSAMLLLASCADEDGLKEISTGIAPAEIEVVSLSDKVLFETRVVGATTAKISLVGDDGKLTELRAAAPVAGDVLSETFTIAELGINEVDDAAHLKIEANGYTVPFSAIQMVSAWNAPAKSKKFTTLEGSTLVDILTFSVNIESWMDESKIVITATCAINSGAAQPLTLASVADEEGADVPSAKQYAFTIDALQSTTSAQAGDTVNILLTATYDNGRSEEFEHAFVITADEFAETSGNVLDSLSLLTTATAPWTSKDSTQTFYGLLSGKAYEGIANADTIGGKSEPVLFFVQDGSSFKLYALPTDSCTIAYASATKDEYTDSNRGVAANKTFASLSGGIAPEGYYALKVTVGTIEPNIYYGYLFVESIFVEDVFGNDVIDGAKYTFNYGLERDYEEE